MLLSFLVTGPSKAEVTCKDNHDGTCTVDYVPTKEGDYDISVKFADKNIPGLLNHQRNYYVNRFLAFVTACICRLFQYHKRLDVTLSLNFLS